MTDKKIVAIMGSPHSNGNLAAALACVSEGAVAKGASFIQYDLCKLQIKPCLGCRKCIENGGLCVLQDDMADVMEAIKTAHLVILGTPIYINQVSGPMKNFLDRMYPMTDAKHRPRFGARALVMLYTYGVPIPLMFSGYIRKTGKSLKAMGLHYKKRIGIHGCTTLHKMQKDLSLQKKLKQLGARLKP